MDDLRPGERVETAEFAPVRVGGSKRRGWSPLVLLGWAGVIAAAVAFGLLGQGATAGGPGRIVHAGPFSSTDVAIFHAPTPAPTIAPTPAASPAPLAYTLAGDTTGITITGTSVAHPVVWVFISVQSAKGDVLSWRSMSVEDVDGGIRPDRSPSFQVHLAVPTAQLGAPVIVDVKAYDDLGRQIGTVRSIIPVFGRGPLRVDTSVLR